MKPAPNDYWESINGNDVKDPGVKIFLENLQLTPLFFYNVHPPVHKI